MRNFFKDGKVIRWGNRDYLQSHWTTIKKYKASYFAIFFKNPFLLFWIDDSIVFVSDGDGKLKITYLFKTFDLEKRLKASWKDGMFVYDKAIKKQKRHYVTTRSGVSFPSRVSENKQMEAKELESASGSRGFFSDVGFLGENTPYLDITHKDMGQPNEESEPNYYWQKSSQKLLQEVKFWYEKKEWFMERNIDWIRSALLTGPGGTGKSKSVLEVAKKMDIPVVRIDIANMCNEEFGDMFRNAEYGSIILIEDLCSVFDGRINVHSKSVLNKQLLTFDFFINTLNGVNQKSGYFLIVTSNHPDKLDPVIKRPGRLDTHIEFGPLDNDGKKFIASNVLKGLNEECDIAINNKKEFTVVEFQNYCIELALENLNKQKNEKIIDF